ncbi:DUF4229 domain-containing protein [Nocardia carnea]|uniref:DUF4229 domain-containing protein n=1 Tax=Nocardia carnea TaxID=37328 RepID=A0ABW7TWQ2_9NOCA|nr:DUF4229 domain-containing protein [Nocardia carnea]
MSESNPSEESAAPQPGTSPGRRLARNLALYTLARLVLVVILTAVIMAGAWVVSVQVPVIVAVLFAIVIAMPLSLTLFKGLRGQVNSDIAAVDERRRRDKAQLRARLRGEAETGGSAGTEPGTVGRGESSKPPKDAAEGEEPGGTGGPA